MRRTTIAALVAAATLLIAAAPFTARIPGVEQIIAGTGVTLSPTDGHGVVTINATGGSGSGCVPSGSEYEIILDSGAGTCLDVSGLGTSTYVLTSNGAGSAPTWQASSGAVSSVTGTSGQITVSPTTGNVVVSLPGTVTQAENFTGGLESGGSSVLVGNQTITLGGDLSGSGATSISAEVTGLSHVTNGSLANSGLANSSITIAGHAVSLGGTQAIACADLAVPCITGNQTITLSGGATGSGTTSIVVTLGDPGPSTLGGIESETCGSNEFVNEISTAGAVTCGTPSGGGSGSNYCDAWITASSAMVSVGSCGSVSSGTWTSPSWIDSTTSARIDNIGGGGGGGYGAAGTYGVGGCGGSDAVYLGTLSASTGYSFSVGAAGSGGLSSGPVAASAGGNTTIVIGATTYTGTGGVAGPVITTGYSRLTCDAATNGQINLTGESGWGAANSFLPSHGGAAPLALSVGTWTITASTAGQSASGYGGGGSGGVSNGFNGGAGSSGVIHIILSGS